MINISNNKVKFHAIYKAKILSSSNYIKEHLNTMYFKYKYLIYFNLTLLDFYY